MAANWFSAPAPVTRRVRAYFAPVNRVSQTPQIFDPREQGSFNLDEPPEPWVSLDWIQGFTRTATSKITAINTGSPNAALEQVRESVEGHVRFEFLSWTKLTMALATGSQHMNLFLPMGTPTPGGDGPTSACAIDTSSSTATFISMASGDVGNFTAGSIVAVDRDYAGQTGFIGSPITGAYVRQPLADVDYVRRVTFNVALVSEVTASGLTLAEPLPGGAPAAGAKVQLVSGFVDRLGGCFYHEWSALFVMEGRQREKIFFYYPRLQTMMDAEESAAPLNGNDKGGLERILLRAQFRALPVADPMDGERILCYRSFLPAAGALA